MWHSTLADRNRWYSQSFVSTGNVSLTILGVCPLVLGGVLTWLCNKYSPEFLRVTVYDSPEFFFSAVFSSLLHSLVNFRHLSHSRLISFLIWDSADSPWFSPSCTVASKLSQGISLCAVIGLILFFFHCPLLTRHQCHENHSMIYFVFQARRKIQSLLLYFGLKWQS